MSGIYHIPIAGVMGNGRGVHAKCDIQEKLRSGAFGSVEEVIHRALIALPTPERGSSPPNQPRKNLAGFLLESPFAGADLDLERRKQYVRRLEL